MFRLLIINPSLLGKIPKMFRDIKRKVPKKLNLFVKLSHEMTL
jgi:hypothetical protein